MLAVNIHAAKTQLSKLVDEAAGGQEVVIARAGKPVAKLVSLSQNKTIPRRVLGRLAGTMAVPPDYDAPLPNDVLAEFEAG